LFCRFIPPEQPLPAFPNGRLDRSVPLTPISLVFIPLFFFSFFTGPPSLLFISPWCFPLYCMFFGSFYFPSLSLPSSRSFEIGPPTSRCNHFFFRIAYTLIPGTLGQWERGPGFSLPLIRFLHSLMTWSFDSRLCLFFLPNDYVRPLWLFLRLLKAPSCLTFPSLNTVGLTVFMPPGFFFLSPVISFHLFFYRLEVFIFFFLRFFTNYPFHPFLLAFQAELPFFL